MVNLRQAELAAWNYANFGRQPSESYALGMAEEVGELCHYIANEKIDAERVLAETIEKVLKRDWREVKDDN